MASTQIVIGMCAMTGKKTWWVTSGYLWVD